MIVFCGIPSEPPLAMAIQAAEEHGLEHLVLNQSDFQLYDVRLDLSDSRVSGTLWAHERECPLEHIRGVYARLRDAPDIPDPPRRKGNSLSDSVTKAAFVRNTLNAWFECAECRVVNRGLRSGSYISRPYQLQRIRYAGFLIPSTLVTNDPTEVLAFQRRHGRVIYKPTSCAHSIVHELTPETARDLDEIRRLPTLFQSYVHGLDVRVHVAGNEVFATQVAGDGVDDRHHQRDVVDVTMEPVTLPDEIEARCRTLSRDLDLPFCGIDLRVTPDGQYFCLDVDPSPAFSDYQEGSGQPIAHALVSYLAGLESGAS